MKKTVHSTGYSEKHLAQIMERIKPCPLCGSKEHVVFGGGPKPSERRIRCIACDLTISQDRDDKVISMWNTRNGKLDFLEGGK